MGHKTALRRQSLLAIFVLSGFAGLIYQSVWSHYLGLFLGHAAYAQALVLALFMGGMALGAAWVARAGLRWRNLIRAYAVVELVIGVFGLAFHLVFTGVLALSYDVLMPAAASPLLAAILKWLLAAALILPQTVLLGMTFPLMSGGLIRRWPGRDGESLGGLYFSNSIGAALGALVSAFVLVPRIGLPGAIVTAGSTNIMIALLAAWLARRSEPLPPAAIDGAAAGAGEAGGSRGLLRLVLGGTMVSGAASFVYEIVWIRLLGMAVGSTMQAFELMLAAFIAGIAFGGLWIRHRADRSRDALRLAGWMQVAMALVALASLAVYTHAFEWVGWLMTALAGNAAGYALFNLGTAGIAILVMLPAAFFAGTTLPLFTVALLRAGHGERAIGRVYAWNTLGAILGVFAAIHVLIPVLGLKLAFSIGALLDLGVGLLLLRHGAESAPARRVLAITSLVSLVVLGLAVTQVRFDPLQLASGVYRTGQVQLGAGTRVLFYRDGKTASVSAYVGAGGVVNIATNGKPDASIAMDNSHAPTPDEPTMVLAAALPLAMHPHPERVGVVGFGSGLTTDVLLADPRVERVDTVEIEAAMVEGARVFGERNLRAYTDPRSNIIIDDAKSYFASQPGRYDIIVSEPSNPWISGIGSLFSREFYEFIPRQLSDDGLFVQWVQLYEIDDRLVASILNALAPAFGDYAAWISNSADLIIVATPADRLPPLDERVLAAPALAAELGRLGLDRTEVIAYRAVADGRLLRSFAGMYPDVVNTDFHPLLSVQAPEKRFEKAWATGIATLPQLQWPLLEMLGVRTPIRGDLPSNLVYTGDQAAFAARQVAAFVTDAASTDVGLLRRDVRTALAQLHAAADGCIASRQMFRDYVVRIDELARQTVHLAPETAAPMWAALSAPDDCDAAWTPVRKAALEVVRAASEREPARMVAAAEAWFDLRADDAWTDADALDETAFMTWLLGFAAEERWDDLMRIDVLIGSHVAGSAAGDEMRIILGRLAQTESGVARRR